MRSESLDYSIENFLTGTKATKDEIIDAFTKVIESTGQGIYKGRNKTAIYQIWDVLLKNNYEVADMQSLADRLNSTADPRVRASNAMGNLNSQIRETGSDVYIETLNTRKLGLGEETNTWYFFRVKR